MVQFQVLTRKRGRGDVDGFVRKLFLSFSCYVQFHQGSQSLLCKTHSMLSFLEPMGNLSATRGPGSRAVVVAAGVIVNLLLSWACVFGTVATNGISKPHFAPGVVINEVG